MSVEVAVEQDLIRITWSGELTGGDLARIASAAGEIERERDPGTRPRRRPGSMAGRDVAG